MGQKSDEPLRWTLHRAANEFGFARQTVKNRIVGAGMSPADDDTYTTKQILAALFGDADGQALRKLTAEADVAEMERNEMDARLIPADIVEAVWQGVIGEMKDVIASLDIPAEERAKIMAAVRDIPLSDYTEAKVAAGDADSAAES